DKDTAPSQSRDVMCPRPEKGADFRCLQRRRRDSSRSPAAFSFSLLRTAPGGAAAGLYRHGAHCVVPGARAGERSGVGARHIAGGRHVAAVLARRWWSERIPLAGVWSVRIALVRRDRRGGGRGAWTGPTAVAHHHTAHCPDRHEAELAGRANVVRLANASRVTCRRAGARGVGIRAVNFADAAARTRTATWCVL